MNLWAEPLTFLVLTTLALAACSGTRVGEPDRVAAMALVCDRNDGGVFVRVKGEQCDTLANPFANVASGSSQGVLVRSYQNIRFIVTVRRPDTSTYEVAVPRLSSAVAGQPIRPARHRWRCLAAGCAID